MLNSSTLKAFFAEILYMSCSRMGLLSFNPVTVLFLAIFNFEGEA